MRFVLLGIPITMAAGALGAIVGLMLGLIVVALISAFAASSLSNWAELSALPVLVIVLTGGFSALGIVLGWVLILRSPDDWLGHRHDYLTCASCQYDLTRNESGNCPECGEPIPARQRVYIKKHWGRTNHA